MAGKRLNGEGSIYFHEGRKLWCAQYIYKGKRKSVYGKTQKIVREKLSEKLKLIEQNIDIDAQEMTLGEWLDYWLETYSRNTVRLSTYTAYEVAIRCHIKPKIGNVKLKKLTASVLQEFFNDEYKSGRIDGRGEGMSVKSLRNFYNLLHSALQKAVETDVLIKNVIMGVQLPKSEVKEERVLSVDEQRKLLKAAREYPHKAGFAVVINLFTGMRIGEILALQWCDVDEVNHTLRVSKTSGRLRTYDDSEPTASRIIVGQPKSKNSNREIPLLGSLYDELMEYKENQREKKAASGLEFRETDTIICNRNFGIMDNRGFSKIFENICRNADIPHANVHSMRHTFATRSLEAGMDVLVLSRILGHAQASTTLNKYGHCLPDHKRESINKLTFLFDEMNSTDT